MIIGITGRKNSGKDTVARMIPDAIIKSFADPIREIGRVFGYSDLQMYKNKDEVHPLWDMSWRVFAQTVGTDMFRHHFGINTWIKIAESNYDPSIITVYQDCRFDNEAEFIKEKGGKIIHVSGELEVRDSHESENGISDWYVDYKIFNAKDRLDNTRSQVDVILKEIKNGKETVSSN